MCLNFKNLMKRRMNLNTFFYWTYNKEKRIFEENFEENIDIIND